MDKLHVTWLEGNGCPNKYLYADKTKCPNENASLCFKTARDTCTRNWAVWAWETKVANNPTGNPV